jgi:NAD(P)-dependent dehydrogenase (short-subunit alcohol dehydrogenase family)
MTHDLTGKVAIVTGASRGIGEAIARAYVNAGASVVISSRKPENVEPVAAEINEAHPDRARAVAAHAGDPESGRVLVEQAVAHFGRVDIAVANAGTNPHFGQLLSSEESQWDKIYEVNVKGAFWLAQAAARQMQRQNEAESGQPGGKIIFMASIAGIEPGPMMGIYSISKAGLIMMAKVLAVELSADNIQVNAIAPGFIKTSFSRALWQNPILLERLTESTPAGRMADPEELAGTALYLASPASSFTTGAVLTVDGGYTLT